MHCSVPVALRDLPVPAVGGQTTIQPGESVTAPVPGSPTSISNVLQAWELKPRLNYAQNYKGIPSEER